MLEVTDGFPYFFLHYSSCYFISLHFLLHFEVFNCLVRHSFQAYFTTESFSEIFKQAHFLPSFKKNAPQLTFAGFQLPPYNYWIKSLLSQFTYSHIPLFTLSHLLLTICYRQRLHWNHINSLSKSLLLKWIAFT